LDLVDADRRFRGGRGAIHEADVATELRLLQIAERFRVDDEPFPGGPPIERRLVAASGPNLA
jgi:hypothetical protein